MNPEEPILPDPDVPVETPNSPVEEPPRVDDVDSYNVARTQRDTVTAATL